MSIEETLSFLAVIVLVLLMTYWEFLYL